MLADLKITRLPDDPALVRTISEWHQAEWGHLSTRTTEDRIAEFAEHGDGIPQTQVALLEGRPVGTASLLTADMDIHQELTPWLASVYVIPERRSRRIGTRLVRTIMEQGARLGVGTMYLFTEDREGFYAAMGWESFEKLSYHGEEITIMKYDVPPE